MNTKPFVSHVAAIFKREVSGYFGSPVAYVFIAIFLLMLGVFTFYISHFFEMGQADLRGFFEWHPWVYMFMIPAVAMRLWAEERRMGTLELIFTMPVTVSEAVIGKFLAAWAFVGVGLILTFPIILTTLYLGDPDTGAIFCGYVGSFLMAGAFLSVGSMTSSFTRSQVISFIIAVVICFFFILAGYPPVMDMLPEKTPFWLTSIVSSLGFMSHFTAMQRGVLDLRDVIYYLSVMTFMLFANGIVIQNRRS